MLNLTSTLSKAEQPLDNVGNPGYGRDARMGIDFSWHKGQI